MPKRNVKRLSIFMIVRAGVISALYFVLTFFMQPLAFGPLQFRVAEAMTLLPIIMPESVIGLTIGCFISNVFSPFGWYDMVFGTLATLIASLLTYMVGRLMQNKRLIFRCLVGAIPPILANATILPAVWLIFSSDAMFWMNFATMLATQTGTIIVIGVPLILGLDKVWRIIKK